MAHNLNKNKKTGKYAFVSSNNQKPWHGLGTVLTDKALTAEQCIREAQLDYEVKLTPAIMRVGSKNVPVPEKFVTYRTDTNTPLGIVGDRYTIVQNHEAFTFFDNLVEKDEAIYETAGALGDGERIFITAKMPDTIRVGKDDLTEVYVALKLSHDGTSGIKAMITPIRIVCQNTLNMALRQAINTVNIRHTRNVHASLQEAHRLLDITHKYVAEAETILNQFSKKKVSDAVFKELVEVLFPGSKEEPSSNILNTREALAAAYHGGVGQENIVGTAYGALQGVSHFFSHDKSYGNGSAGKFTNLMETTAKLKIQQAFNFLDNLN